MLSSSAPVRAYMTDATNMVIAAGFEQTPVLINSLALSGHFELSRPGGASVHRELIFWSAGCKQNLLNGEISG